MWSQKWNLSFSSVTPDIPYYAFFFRFQKTCQKCSHCLSLSLNQKNHLYQSGSQDRRPHPRFTIKCWRHAQGKRAVSSICVLIVRLYQAKSGLRVRLYQASVSMLRQLCDDATNNVPIENNEVTWKWVDCSPILEWLHCFQWELYH